MQDGKPQRDGTLLQVGARRCTTDFEIWSSEEPWELKGEGQLMRDEGQGCAVDDRPRGVGMGILIEYSLTIVKCRGESFLYLCRMTYREEASICDDLY
jgi:hypothetical protein